MHAAQTEQNENRNNMHDDTHNSRFKYTIYYYIFFCTVLFYPSRSFIVIESMAVI